jgi:MSHA biogenesis protein MshN
MVWQFGRNPIIVTLFIVANLVNVVFAEDLFAENNINDLLPIKNHTKEHKQDRIVKEELPLSSEEQASINYAKGIELLKKSQEVEAAVLFKKILEELPKYHKARIQLIQLYQKIGWLDEVEKLLQAGLDLVPDHEDFIKNLAFIYNQKSQPRKALSILLTMPEQNSQQIDYISLLALSYLNVDQADMAEKYYQQLLTFNKENPIWWLGLAVAQDAGGKYKNAITSFNQAKNLSRFNAETLDYINNKLEQIKQYY